MTEPYKIIEVKESVFADNDREAARLRTQLKQDRTFLLNLMSSPGSGKTTTLLRTLEALKDELHIGVMEADIDSDVDAKTIADAGVKSIQLHTGGMCHLDASMTEQGLKEIGTKDLDLVVLENVGNLVCPAEFDTGAVKNAMILSVPEGHDKPLKYPLIFTVCDALIINKIDVLPYFDFDMEKVVEYAHMRNPKLKIFPLSAKTGEGVDAWWELAARAGARLERVRKRKRCTARYISFLLCVQPKDRRVNLSVPEFEYAVGRAARIANRTGIHHHRPRRRVHERHVRVAEEQNVGVHLERAVLRAEKSGLHP